MELKSRSWLLTTMGMCKKKRTSNILEQPLKDSPHIESTIHHVCNLIVATVQAVMCKTDLSGKAVQPVMSCLHDGLDVRFRSLYQFFFGCDSRDDTMSVTWLIHKDEWENEVLKKDPIYFCTSLNEAWDKNSFWKQQYKESSTRVMHLTLKRTPIKSENIKNHAKLLKNLLFTIEQFMNRIDKNIEPKIQRTANEVLQKFSINADDLCNRAQKHLEKVLSVEKS